MNSISIYGYLQERRGRTGSGGGVCTYIKDSINYKLRSDIPTDDVEIIYNEINLRKCKSRLVIVRYRDKEI